MTNPFELVVRQLLSLGFYDFLFPFIITATIVFGLLKKSKILSESWVINGVVSLSIAFMIFGFPVIVGVSLASPFSTYFTQITVFVLVFVMGLLLASFFYPDLTGMLLKQVTRRSSMYVMIAIAIAFFITSGMVNIFFPPAKATTPGTPAGTPTDVILIAAAVVIFIVLIIIAVAIARGM